ncbi:hypothetical protein FHR83_005630 [Actinoplanes campanulatus]|uniref:Uncharacterized protein n=1 Tax=Actinoplanes campanulatus TaxID=113559 RepID=A0A7W5FGZ3_9ACTN|nr:hypothetical protein [Actinoplanes campanulatus]MBB3097945.1 hypothetical protein [Actinoplanes campanulatus]GGN31530.1 hypothetical protein GCM10010109_51800 [Actinoplanes campanulatus]GID41330.1 hypothetical protein Aca09nite_78360 [Actinoplanes campanulatus]
MSCPAVSCDSASVVPLHVDGWITGIVDVTPLVRRIRGHLDVRDVDAASVLLPAERLYPYPENRV